MGGNHAERLEQIALQRAATEKRLAGLNARWQQEAGLVSRIREMRTQLDEAYTSSTAVAEANGKPSVASGNGNTAKAASVVAPAVDLRQVNEELTKLNTRTRKLSKAKRL